MKKQLQLIFFMLAFVATVNAQVEFSDDFESYTAGALLGESSDVWATWSGMDGAADDAAIVDDNANSGSNSLRLTGIGAGGPDDMILPFGGRYTSGNFHLDFMINVVEGASAYYNFQGDVAAGSQWVYNVFMTADGVINFAAGGNENVMAATFTPGTWTKMGVDVDLTNNVWAFTVNDECVGSFQNATNNLASWNLYPIGGDDYYIDDVNYSYDEAGEASVTDAMLTLDRNLPVGVVDGSVPISGTVTNIGTTVIDGFEIVYNGVAESFTGTLEPLGEFAFTLAEQHTVAAGANAGTVALRGVSGDENACNNISTLVSRSIDVPRGKVYVAEEATGTWCGWCPRGDVFMNYMNDSYKDLFIGIAMHNSDPMEVEEYNDAFTSQAGFQGFPSVWSERSSYIDPSGLESDFVTKIQEASPAELSIAAEYDETSRKLKINANVEALTTILPSSSVIVVITEDGVTGETTDYAQANFYAGGGQGVMGGFELLPSPVPAADMVYNHVARALVNGFEGENFGTGMASGDRKTFAYTYDIPEEWDAEKLHIIAIYRNGNGTTPTGSKATIEEAELNPLSSTVDPVLASKVDVYPNPFGEQTNVRLDLEVPANVRIDITDALGRIVSTRNYGTQAGSLTFPVMANRLDNGIYFVNIFVDDSFTSKRVVVSK